jgi:branched-chain amino acid aminotransferase
MTALPTTRPFQPRVELHSDPVGPGRREAILDDPGFGRHFTDHMVLAEWTPETGWHDERVVPYGPLVLDQAARKRASELLAQMPPP